MHFHKIKIQGKVTSTAIPRSTFVTCIDIFCQFFLTRRKSSFFIRTSLIWNENKRQGFTSGIFTRLEEIYFRL